ncbi:anti-sigma factor domain-containing protein [Caproiciproducens faecalis]|uniref:Anti-sigma factor domain-containing protein n=1 Tax=Caproiciproducens faecalis TaxID=2820301 RepID=A0ABS7DJ93_9FIRM|nr:anti-sigma factor domain-containing protein [Caproiciproducens faecalis]MBW7571365.1 anti-sigma factor domain-containing protein [Caproiciproducens faecalis]
MKACVVEIRKNFAAVLTDDGCVMNVKNRNYTIGQVIDLKKSTLHFSVKTAAVAASIAVLLVLSGVTAWAYYTPSCYVSLDVNPSIEYSVNRFDRVLSVQAVNNDGADIISNLDLNNQTIDDAIKSTVDQIQSEGYFKDSGGIIISTSSDNAQTSEELAEDLQNVAIEATKDSGAPVEVEAISVGRERVLEAQKLGTTPGKLNLVQKLQKSAGNEDISVEEWLKKPVKDIMKAIKTARQESKSTDGSSEDPVDSSSSSSAEGVVSFEAEAESQAQSSSAESKISSKKPAGNPAAESRPSSKAPHGSSALPNAKNESKVSENKNSSSDTSVKKNSDVDTDKSGQSGGSGNSNANTNASEKGNSKSKNGNSKK